ncbi:MAG: UDP-N-acetylglucosamine--N-acetylmuramyl-(pentapeptide) pyrophosphoryl-undecaprenol N-acetylglucosamine transferase, partial [Neofamilia sp.]
TTRAGYKYETVRVKGLPRSINLDSFKIGVELLKGLYDANKILKKFKPDIVIGTGGYVAFPVLFLAQQKGIKTILQESNAFPGKVNRILAKKANGIAISFEEAKNRFTSSNCFMAGNPIRKDFFTVNKIDLRKEIGVKENEKLILSFGGSGGQESINNAIIGIIEASKDFKYRLIHITGRSHYDEFMKVLNDRKITINENIKIMDYSHEMINLLASSDLAILSSSAISLAEVSALGIPSILVPKAYTADNHQEYNARAFEKAGASRVFLEDELTSENLLGTIIDILENETKMKKMGECAKILSKPNSTEIIVDKIFSIIK